MHSSRKLVVEVYNGTTRIDDVDHSLERASAITFDTFYPGGLFGAGSFFCPRNPTRSWQVLPGHRAVIRSGLDAVWEGRITSFTDGDGGVAVNGTGLWGLILGRQMLNKRWADTRVDEAAWVYPQVRADTNNRQNKADCRRGSATMTLVPHNIRWYGSQYAYIEYSMPTGQTIKRIAFDYDFSESTLNLKGGLYDPVGATYLWSVMADGIGSQDIELATPRQVLQFRFESVVEQVMDVADLWLAISSITVYSELGNINLTEIAKDVVGATAELSSDVRMIGANALALEPFMSNGMEYKSDILLHAASFGDSSLIAWSVGLRESDIAGTLDGLPVLYAESQPALTNFDYKVSVIDKNLQTAYTMVRDASGVANYIILKFKDPSGPATTIQETILTPDDDATLQDLDSIAFYGRIEVPLDAGVCSQALAVQYAQRYLASNRWAKVYVSNPIVVKGYIRGANSERIPAEKIRAGMRLKIESYLTDEAMVAGAGLIFLISQTSYNGDDDTCRITAGVPDDTAVWLAQYRMRT